MVAKAAKIEKLLSKVSAGDTLPIPWLLAKHLENAEELLSEQRKRITTAYFEQSQEVEGDNAEEHKTLYNKTMKD